MPTNSHTTGAIASRNYARSLLKELSLLTRRNGDPFLAYMIEMAALAAARRQRSRNRSKPASPQIARLARALVAGTDEMARAAPGRRRQIPR